MFINDFLTNHLNWKSFMEGFLYFIESVYNVN